MLILLLIVDFMLFPFSPILFFILLPPIIIILIYLGERYGRSSNRVEGGSHSIQDSGSGRGGLSLKDGSAELQDSSAQINNLLTRINELESTLSSLRMEVLKRDKIIAELKKKIDGLSDIGLEDARQADLEVYRELLAALELKHNSGEISSEEYYSLKSKYEDKIRRLSI